MKKEWVLTRESFDGLLGWLDPERDRAAQKYEAIRRRLIKFFSMRGCIDAEELTDETINRVAARVGEIAGTFEGDPAQYFYGVSKKVHHEYVRKPQPVRISADSGTGNQPLTAAIADGVEREYRCLERCMEHLSGENRVLVLSFYQQVKRAKINHRQKLATELGVTLNALRIRAHRIKVALTRCIHECLEERAL